MKTPESIVEKMQVRNIPREEFLEGVQDIAGLRIMCQFVDDIYEVVRLIRQRNDFDIVIERDYIQSKKASGYRSYHIVLEYPVQRIEGETKILVEIQIRTLAMNFWATIEHSLNYKYKGEFPDTIHERLERAAEAAFLLDEEMSQIREEIQEAQYIFAINKENQRKRKKRRESWWKSVYTEIKQKKQKKSWIPSTAYAKKAVLCEMT